MRELGGRVDEGIGGPSRRGGVSVDTWAWPQGEADRALGEGGRTERELKGRGRGLGEEKH